MTPDLAILYEHPDWFRPLFAALGRRGIVYEAIRLGDHHFDPADASVPAPLILSRVAMSAVLRDAEHGIFYAQGLLAHWAANGARVLNGAGVLALDSAKARQLSLLAGLGLAVPRTRVVHRAADVPAAAQELRFPVLVKANLGGSGAGIARYDDRAALDAAVAARLLPESADRVLLVQELVPPREGRILRLETLGGRFLYALGIETDGRFDLCPAEACVVAPGRSAVAMRAVEPGADLVLAAERIAEAAGLDVGGIEMMIDDRDGIPRFFDINALSNFVADPLEILGWDPHERLVDFLEDAMAVAPRLSLRA